VTALTVSRTRRSYRLPAKKKGRHESQERFEAPQARRKLIEQASSASPSGNVGERESSTTT
jgi:hypothetical protein